MEFCLDGGQDFQGGETKYMCVGSAGVVLCVGGVQLRKEDKKM